MTATLAISVSDEVYLRRLRALGAWWRLGSSALNPELLVARVECAVSWEADVPLDVPAASKR